MKEKNQFLVNFIVRAILGMGIIFFANQVAKYNKISIKALHSMKSV